MLSAPPRPRTHARRVVIAGSIDVVGFGAAGGVVTLLQDWLGNQRFLSLAGFLVLGSAVAWLAPKVSYRRRDALWAPWSFWIIAWRIAYLPDRDWPPRDDEVKQARYLSRTELGDRWRPEYAGLWRNEPGADRVLPERGGEERIRVADGPSGRQASGHGTA